tara:strand:- start:87 stop:455 length:369 start_codon:yes stop_codon:yes gene_type:complete
MTQYIEVVCNNIILAHRAKLIKSFLGKAKGLMFSRIVGASGLIFELEKESRRNATIHMLFVLSKIDVLWLDSNKRIVDIKQNLTPFIGFARPKEKARYVVELPSNSTQTVKVGDIIEFREEE